METIILILKFVVGLAAIIKGADWLTDGASAIARRYGIPSIVIGLTIVAFGTSAPELVVSVVSAVEGKTEMAVGNVVGSNIFNTLAIMGITALIYPVACSKNNIRYDVPLCLLASIALMALALDGDIVSRGDGITLLCFFLIFMFYTFAIAKQPNGTAEGEQETKAVPLWRSIVLFLVGLACLILGGEWFVDGASGFALMMGVSQSVVALTIVAAGTSFPELVTSIVAARKGDTDMAMGNVVGSNIFNIFMVLGVASVLNPLQLGNISPLDLGTMTFGAFLLWVFCKFGRRYHYVTRTEGALLTICAVAYYTAAVLMATGTIPAL